jgi:hypothetical protein
LAERLSFDSWPRFPGDPGPWRGDKAPFYKLSLQSEAACYCDYRD